MREDRVAHLPHLTMPVPPPTDDYAIGFKAGWNQHPISDCPYAPSDPEGLTWRQGWFGGWAHYRRTHP